MCEVPAVDEAGEQSGEEGKTSGWRRESGSVVWAEAGDSTKNWTFTEPHPVEQIRQEYEELQIHQLGGHWQMMVAGTDTCGGNGWIWVLS